MFTNLSGATGALIGLAVVVFFIVRQFSTRPVASWWMVAVPAALAVFGARDLVLLDTSGWVLLAISSSLGVGLGFARGVTFRVWVAAHGTALMRGTALTLLLWVATIAIKTGLSVFAGYSGIGTNTAEMLLPVAATLAAQNLVVYLRSRDQGLVAAI